MNITNDLNYVTGTQVQKFIFLSRNEAESRVVVSVGGNVNVGSPDTKATNSGYLAFGGYENGTTLKRVTIGGNVNIYGSAELQLSVGGAAIQPDQGNCPFADLSQMGFWRLCRMAWSFGRW